MKILFSIIKYQLQDSLRNKWLLVYFLFFFVICYGLILTSNDQSKIILSLMNVSLLLIPLTSIIYGTIYFYNNRDYIILILSQPVARKIIYLGLYIGLTLAMVLSFVFGIALPILISFKSVSDSSVVISYLLLSGIFQTTIFVALSFLIAVLNENRMKGLGISIFVWLLFSALYDGFIMLLLNILKDYPIDYLSLGLTILNPIDLSRILIIMNFDVAALLGYTGAVFQNFFSTSVGIVIAVSSLLIWSVVPIVLGLIYFNKKDF